MPYITVGEKSFLSEEHIETFLMNQHELVSIFIDPVEPFQSELENLGGVKNQFHSKRPLRNNTCIERKLRAERC